MTDPIVTVTVWRGPLSALAARQRLTADDLRKRLRQHGQRRGAEWDVMVSSSTALATLRRVLTAETTD